MRKRDRERENYLAQMRYYNAKHKARLKSRVLKYKYGITLEEYQQMFEGQSGVCAVCKTNPDGKMLAVDHDHETGQVRGLLCFRCNSTLGKFNDNSLLIRELANYLDTKRDKLKSGR